MSNPIWTCKPEKTAELEDLRAGNTDPYGAAGVAYMDAWGSMMQAIIASEGLGALTPERIKRTSHDANTGHISGYMFGLAKWWLSELWVHGDLLAAPEPTP